MTSKTFTLKDLAEAGYIMGLATIGEVVLHVELHYDAYWDMKEVAQRTHELRVLTEGREDDSIFKYLTDEDKKKMDDELDKAMAEGPDVEQREAPDETEGEAT